MRALIGGKGPDRVLDDIDPPTQLGAIRVQVHAAGLNRADLYALDGTYTANSQEEGPFTAGMEVAGVVETGSMLAPHLPAGTRVMGITVGAFADYTLCHPRLVVPIPDNLSFDEAAALPVGLNTEHDALVTQAGFTAGNSVLIVGGTSSIGLIGIQLAKALGASTVIATTTSEAKRDALTAAGADVAINSADEDLTATVLAATEGKGADITLDHVGGNTFALLPSATAVGGVIVSIGRLAGAATELDLDTIAFRRQKLIGTTVAGMFGSIAQIGYVVRDLENSMKGFVAAGVGPWFHLEGVRPNNFTYQGQPSDMVMDVAVANSGDIQIELISPANDAPSMYADFLAAGNEGVQHIAYWSENYQDLYDRALAAGFTAGQEGQIGGEDGRFAYLNTEHHPGTVVEISDVGGSKKFIFDLIKLAANGWDGSNPIQKIDAALIGGDPAATAAIMEAFG